MKEISLTFPESFKEFGITEENYLSSEGIPIVRFSELRKYVAELSCIYPDSILYFRGQTNDHKRPYGKKGNASTFFPSIYRKEPNTKELANRWDKLLLATEMLVERLESHPDKEKREFEFLRTKRLAQWSVLQHYEVVDTPLLDVTQSLRVACSFAHLNRKDSEYAYIYVFAIPYPTGRISINSEHYLTNIRLLSVVPSSVRRPHNQEGFLLGEDDINKTDRVLDTFDFRRRAIAKFKIHIGSPIFWEVHDGLSDRPLMQEELYPDLNDQDILYDICNQIRKSIDEATSQIPQGADLTAEFLRQWRIIELYMKGYSREMSLEKNHTFASGLKEMKRRNYDRFSNDEDLSSLINELDTIRKKRNALVHHTAYDVNIMELLHLANQVIPQMEKKIPGIRHMSEFYQKELTYKHRNSK